MRITKKDILALILLTVTVVIFFGRLFYPNPQIFITPEMGVSDIWQLNYPLKVFLQESLKNGHLPLWNKNMGGGFPLLAEAQIGTFFLPNIILLYLFASYTAFNLMYVVTFLTAGFSLYFLAKYFKLSTTASLLSSFTFMFSGFFVAHISHLNVIQAASFLPLLFLLSIYIVNQNHKRWTLGLIALYAFVLSQQIFAGFPQMVFLTLFAVFLYCGFLLVIKIRDKKILTFVKPICILIISIALGFLLSSIQLLPTLELTGLSKRDGGLDPAEVLNFSFKPELFKTFVDPWAAGSPRDGTYPDYTKFSGAIFWENIGYIGILPLIFVLFSLFVIRKNKTVLFFWIFCIVSVLLMLGKYSPLYVVLVFPPMNFFRIHSRFILLAIFSLTILSGFGLDYCIQKIKAVLKQNTMKVFLPTLVGIFAVTITYVDITRLWFNYHALADVKQWISEPETVSYLKTVDHGRFFSLNRFSLWRDHFLEKGWVNSDEYFDARNGLHPNLSIFYNLPSAEIYTALYTRRWMYFISLIQSGMNTETVTKSVNKASSNLLSASNITHIIGTKDFNAEGFTKVFETVEPVFDFSHLVIYKNENAVDRAYFTNNYTVADTVADVFSMLISTSFEPGNTVIIEKNIDLPKDTTKQNAEIEILTDEHQYLSIKLNAPKDGLLVVSDSYYPGWKALVDGKETEILPANINQRAVIIPKGEHTIEFIYTSMSLEKGRIISAVTLAIIVILAAFQSGYFFLRKDPDNTRSSHRRHSKPYTLKRATRKTR